jgi:hypothetical protein
MLEDPLFFTVACVGVFAYTGVLSTLVLTNVQRPLSRMMRRHPVVGAAFSAVLLLTACWAVLSSARAGLLLATFGTQLAYLMFVKNDDQSRPIAKLLIAFVLAHGFVLAIATLQPPRPLVLDGSGAAAAANGDGASYGSTTKLLSSGVATRSVVLLHDGARVGGQPTAHLDFRPPAGLTPRPGLVVYGSDIVVERVELSTASAAAAPLLLVLGQATLRDVVLRCVVVPCLMLAPDAVLRNVTVAVAGQAAPLVLDGDARAVCKTIAQGAVACASETERAVAAAAYAPWWAVIEQHMPAVVRVFRRVAGWLSALAGWCYALTVAHGGTVAAFAFDTTKTATLLVKNVGADVVCGGVAGAESLTAARAVEFCQAVAPWSATLRLVSENASLLLCAVGLPALLASVTWWVGVQRFVVETAAFAVYNSAGVAVGPVAGLALSAGMSASAWAAAATAPCCYGVARGYAYYVSTFVAFQFTAVGWLYRLAAVAGSLLAVGVGATWVVAVWLKAAYAQTSFSTHMALAIGQTAVLSVSLYKEYVKQRDAHARAESRATSWLVGARTVAASRMLATEAPRLLRYGAVHLLAAVLVFGGSFLSFLPWIGFAVLHVAFPLASVHAILAFFNRDSNAAVAAVFAARVVAAIVFQHTVGNVLHRLLMELLQPLLYTAVIGGALLAVRYFGATKKSDGAAVAGGVAKAVPSVEAATASVPAVPAVVAVATPQAGDPPSTVDEKSE